MVQKSKIRHHPSKVSIVEAQREIWSQQLAPWEDPAKHCWACGTETGSPARAHIQAKVFDGSNEPDNFFLLCKACHKEQPDGCPKTVQLEWIFSRDHCINRMAGDIQRLLREAFCSEESLSGLMHWCNNVFSLKAFNERTRSAALYPETVYANAVWTIRTMYEEWRLESIQATSN